MFLVVHIILRAIALYVASCCLHSFKRQKFKFVPKIYVVIFTSKISYTLLNVSKRKEYTMPNNYYENQTPLQEPTTPQRTESENLQVPPLPDTQSLQQSTPDINANTINENAENETSENTFPDNSEGNLRIGVTTNNQLSPIAGATVTVSSVNQEGAAEVVDSSVTDSSGSTVTFTLPAPSASFSQEPTVLLPFAIYQVSVSHPDFYDFLAENVQVFGGITTQLPVTLIPLPELPNGERTDIVVIPKQNL